MLALLALAAAIASEQFAEHLWERHSLFAGLVSSAIVVMLSVAIVNETLEIRGRRRWSVLAQYVMLELVRDARMVWMEAVELAGLMPAEANSSAGLDVAAVVVRDTPRMTNAVRGLLADDGRRRVLRNRVSRVAVHNDEVLGRWAAVMLNAEAYAEVIDRHVELPETSPGLRACWIRPRRAMVTSFAGTELEAAPPSRSRVPWTMIASRRGSSRSPSSPRSWTGERSNSP